MINSLAEFESLIEERKSAGIALFDVGQTFDDPRDKIKSDAWSMLVWASVGCDKETLARLVADEEGKRILSVAPHATNVHVMGRVFDEYIPEYVWDNWSCEDADQWPVHSC